VGSRFSSPLPIQRLNLNAEYSISATRSKCRCAEFDASVKVSEGAPAAKASFVVEYNRQEPAKSGRSWYASWALRALQSICTSDYADRRKHPIRQTAKPLRPERK
jgi:hypothetical protein